MTGRPLVNLERLRFLAGCVALVIVVACVGVALFVGASGRDFAQLGPALGWIGTIAATLFLYSGLSNQIGAVHKQVNGNLEREVNRADTAYARLAELVQGVSTPTPVQNATPVPTQDDPQVGDGADTGRHWKE